MKKLLIGAAMALLSFTATADFTSAEMAEHLNKSTGELLSPRGGPMCTATKIAPRQWLTAGHCIAYDVKIETANGDYLFPQSWTVGVSKKGDNIRREDWAIINTTTEAKDVPALELACGEDIYAGQKVAYVGFPYSVERGYFEGYITSVRKSTKPWNNADWIIDIRAAGGASGAALVDMKSGQVLGVLTEGVTSPRNPFYLTAAESVQNVDSCKDWNRKMHHWEGQGEKPFIPTDNNNNFVDWT